MAKKNQVQISDILTKGRIIGIFYLVIAVVFLVLPNVMQCGGCTGWNIINPLCWIGVGGCNLAKTILAVIGWIGAVIFILWATKNFIVG
jgi:hypothetical protein